MARHNKIYAGPFTEATPQVREMPASVAILPGSLVTIVAGKFALAGAATTGKIFVAQDNYLTMKGVDDTVAIDDVVIGMELLDEQFFNVRLVTGMDVKIGDSLSLAANGAVSKAGAGVVGYAEENYNNTTGTNQLIRMRASAGAVRVTA